MSRTERPGTRLELTFLSRGERMAAWFYPPSTGDPAAPLVILAHGLGGTRHMRLDAYASRFAAAGLAALVFDYRGFGDSGGEPRQVVDIRSQLDDWHAALAFARSGLPVDPQRIAIWGTSFGGGHVLQVAAEDPDLAAVVAQCPFTDGMASSIRRFLTAPLSASVLFVLAVADVAGRPFGAGPLLAPMAGTPWMPAFLAAPDSLAGACDQAEPGTELSARSSVWARRLPSIRRRIGAHLRLSERTVPRERDSLWGVLIAPSGALMINAIAARLLFRLALYRPAKALRRSGTTPILICGCDHDSVAPIGPTVKAAAGRPNVRLLRYPYGHFEIYVGDAFERASADQLDFLLQALTPQTLSEVA